MKEFLYSVLDKVEEILSDLFQPEVLLPLISLILSIISVIYAISQL